MDSRTLQRLFRTACLLFAAVMLPSWASADADYPICGRVLIWPDRCIVGQQRSYAEVYFTRPVHRQGTPFELPRGEAISNITYQVYGKTYSLDDYFEKSRTTGMMVLKGGAIVFERYLLGANERTLFTSHSITKSIVSTLVGFTIADGLVHSVDDPISDYVPELKQSGFGGVPIKAVLQMSSGVAWREDYGSPNSDWGKMTTQSYLLNQAPVTDFARNAKAFGKPFLWFNYAGVNSVALGWLVSRVTGKTLAEYLSEKLWGPLGMEADANWVIDAEGPTANEMANCCLSATLRDLARFGLLFAQNGVWQGKQLLLPAWVANATQPDSPQVAFGRLYPGYKLGYQYQWWAFPGPDHAFAAHGSRGQYVYVNPVQNVVIVVTNAWPTTWDDTLEEHTHALFGAFEEALRH